MKTTLFAVLFTASLFAVAAPAEAGGKPDGASCHVSKSCKSKYCVTLNPTDKFGVCCTPADCPELNAQCGSIDNGCGVAIQCGDCSPGDSCLDNQCVTGPTTTTIPPTTTLPPTTTTSTTTTSTTVGQTTTTTIVPTTTLAAVRSCAGYCNQPRTVPPGSGPNCYCDNLACSQNDGCADFYPTCDVNPTYTCD